MACVERIAMEQVLESLPALKARPKEACVTPTDSVYRYKTIEEFFSQEKCLATVSQRIAVLAKSELEDRTKAERDAASAAETAKRDAQALTQYTNELRNGKRAPTTFSEELIRDRVSEGSNIAAYPKVRPDGLRYGISLILDTPDSEQGFFGRIPGINASTFVYVTIPPALREAYLGKARVGTPISVVGAYVNNRQMRSITGSVLTIPVLKAERISSLQ